MNLNLGPVNVERVAGLGVPVDDPTDDVEDQNPAEESDDDDDDDEDHEIYVSNLRVAEHARLNNRVGRPPLMTNGM